MWKYHATAIDSKEAVNYYDRLTQYVEKIPQKKIFVYGKPATQNRIVGYFSNNNVPYSYSGTEQINYGWPKEIQELANVAEALSGQTFDSALINWYRNGQDYIGLHNDKDAMLNPIVSFTFYPDENPVATEIRTFRIRPMESKEYTDIQLEQGSALVMKTGMQQKYKHELPVRKRAKKGRINATFRIHAQ
jgi:alkylated DNA repair dioxygenase AlkB